MFVGMDVSPYVEYHRSRIEASRARRATARKQALQALETMQPIFSSTPGLRRVYLFGSLGRDRFREDSDIDLAVEGIGAEGCLRLHSQLSSMAPCDLDLVDLGDCGEAFTAFIRRYGRVIYERCA